MSYEPAAHYDRVTAAWTLLLGEDLHYGVFEAPHEPLANATRRLTELMMQVGEIERGALVLDVGCGIGAPACHIARVVGARVIGITTSHVGVAMARARAEAAGVGSLASFECRDGMDNGFEDGTFDRVWALESSHLMRDRRKLMSECARVLRPGGRLVLCDIVLRKKLDLAAVRRLLRPLRLLREVFGDARMEPLTLYRRFAGDFHLRVDHERDLTAATRPTFDHWRDNAEQHAPEITGLIGELDLQRFVEACDVLEQFWDGGILGYALISGLKL